ncbi:hypothetical protein [Clostridium ljungdahlii]|uniref:Uncharacterized protein n=1 Tax=Clostridium ljungdahlii TaxID=1538 RepID=A0A162J762_9CLOT|nr:hypothetical protein [Clostridium ljungdahlii]OAA91285.1 hypothetical protein WY13_00850 [Clostridium ljungdahlii]
MMDVNKYFEEVNLKLNALSDEELENLLVESGIEDCPYEDDNTIYCGNINNDEIVNEKFSGLISEVENVIFSKTIKSRKSNELLELKDYDVYDVFNNGEDAA